MPNYPSGTFSTDYASLLEGFGNLPSNYRAAQLQQGQVDVQNAFKGGVPTNDDGTPNYAAALQIRAKAGDPNAIEALGPMAQTQAWQQGAQGTMSPMLAGGAGGGQQGPPAAPMQLPAAPPQAAQSPPLGPTLFDIASGAPKAAEWLGKALGVAPTTPLTPDQVAKAKSYLNNMLRASGSLTAAMGAQQLPQPQSGFAGRVNVPPDPAVAGARAIAAPASGSAQGDATISALKANISGIESGGDYGITGPVTRDGDRAYGKYQVMGANVGPWTQEVFGKAMTPEQFLKNPGAQEKVADFQMRKLASQGYSPKDISSIWFTGKPLAEGANRKDQLGTIGSQYAEEATKGIATAQGNRPIVPQFPLPPGFPDTDAGRQQAILAIDKEIAKAATNPNPYAEKQIPQLEDIRNRIAASAEPKEVRPGEALVDAYGRTLYQAPSMFQQRDTLNQSRASDIAEGIKRGDQPPTTTGLYGMAPIVRDQLAKDGFNLVKAQLEYQAAQKQVNSLNGPQQVRFVGLANSVVNTIDEVLDLSKKMELSGVPALNAIELAGYIQTQGNSANGQLATDYMTAVGTLKEEFANLANGGYAPTEPAWKLADQQINANYGVKQLPSSLSEVQRLIKYRLNAMPGMNTIGPGAANPYVPGSGQGAGTQPGPPPTQSAPGAGASGGGGGHAPARVTKEQYDALPKGAPYIAIDDPTQTPRTKP